MSSPSSQPRTGATQKLDYAAAQKGLTSSGISLAELRNKQLIDARRASVGGGAAPPPAPPCPPPPPAFMDADVDAYQAFCGEVAALDAPDAVAAPDQAEMTWEGIEDLLRSMMDTDQPQIAELALGSSAPVAPSSSASSSGVPPATAQSLASGAPLDSMSLASVPGVASDVAGAAARPPEGVRSPAESPESLLLKSLGKALAKAPAKSPAKVPAKLPKVAASLRPVKEEIEEEPLRPQVVQPHPPTVPPPRRRSAMHSPSASQSSRATYGAEEDLWSGVPDFVDVAEPRAIVTKKELAAPSRLVPSGHKLVKLRPAPTYEAQGNSSQASPFLVVKSETPAQQEIVVRRDSRRKQAFLRDATCKAICQIKHGLRQAFAPMDSLFVPENWHKDFETLLGDYIEFLRSRPDQFLLVPLSGSNGFIDKRPGDPSSYAVVDVAGAVTVKAGVWGSWKVKSEQEWKVKSEKVKVEGGWGSKMEVEKTQREQWNEAEPLPSLKRPCSSMPAGTPWGKLQKTEVAFVPRQSQPSPGDVGRGDGEWCKANAWKRSQPLSMEPLTTPLPPMRPVRNMSSIPGAVADSSAPDRPPVTEAANAAADEDEEPECDESGDDDCFVLDVIGGEPNLGPCLLTVKEEEKDDHVDTWALLNDSSVSAAC